MPNRVSGTSRCGFETGGPVVQPGTDREPAISAPEEFLRMIRMNPVALEIACRMRLFDLPDAWLVSGCLFQTVWNVLAGEKPTRGIRDYDLFYFDATDISGESEARINRRVAGLCADLDCELDVRNQARVHTWYPSEFGVDCYPRLERSTDGIDHFLAICCMVAIRPAAGGSLDIYAPFGVEDVLARVVRPNPWYPNAPIDCYYRKAERWQALWPDLEVEPWPNSGGGEIATGRRSGRPTRAG